MAGVPQDSPIVQQAAVMGTGNAPSIVLGSAAGSGASVSIVGNNVAGKITLTSGASLLVSGTVMTLTLANGLSFPNGSVVTYSAGNSAFASVLGLISGSTTATTIALSVSAALTLSTVYIGYYSITGY
jgi:hypothetical protein